MTYPPAEQLGATYSFGNRYIESSHLRPASDALERLNGFAGRIAELRIKHLRENVQIYYGVEKLSDNVRTPSKPEIIALGCTAQFGVAFA